MRLAPLCLLDIPSLLSSSLYYQVYCILYSKGRHRSIYLRYRLLLDAGGDAISKTSIIMWVSHFADHFLIGRSEP